MGLQHHDEQNCALPYLSVTDRTSGLTANSFQSQAARTFLVSIANKFQDKSVRTPASRATSVDSALSSLTREDSSPVRHQHVPTSSPLHHPHHLPVSRDRTASDPPDIGYSNFSIKGFLLHFLFQIITTILNLSYANTKVLPFFCFVLWL